MLDFSQSPFPENTTCKNCITRPCRKLFSGRVFPGKMIFLHRNEFLSLPCHQPTFAQSEDAATQSVALTDELADMVTDQEQPIEISNPRWKPTEEDASTDYTFVDDIITLLADVKNYPEGAPVTFEIFDVTKDPPLRIGSARGKNEGGIGKGEWRVKDPNKHGKELKLEFDGEIRSKKSERVPIEVKVIVTGGVHLVFEDQYGEQLKGVEAKVTVDGEEIYCGIADSGEVGLTEIPFVELLAECTYEGATITKDLHWNGGKPPYTKEVIVITTSTDREDA